LAMSPQLGDTQKMRTRYKGGGAQFWAYISPQNETEKYVTKWIVRLEQKDGDWSDFISSDDPTKILQTPNLSGVFRVVVRASGPLFEEKQLTNLPDSKPDVGCNSNCFAMVGIVANQGGKDAHYWTVWDAFCD
jgi:hypothetical protein